ncbi:MAG TPA: hypothetical protein VMF35_05395, partial [Acidimicrobiales bacterium]|nr:hypothetical protein [Acidimicrobiales bacterium]
WTLRAFFRFCRAASFCFSVAIATSFSVDDSVGYSYPRWSSDNGIVDAHLCGCKGFTAGPPSGRDQARLIR